MYVIIEHAETHIFLLHIRVVISNCIAVQTVTFLLHFFIRHEYTHVAVFCYTFKLFCEAVKITMRKLSALKVPIYADKRYWTGTIEIAAKAVANSVDITSPLLVDAQETYVISCDNKGLLL